MKIIDSFMFCHELDLLEARLHLLWDYVDRFVILECDYTHQNKEKPMYLRDNMARFEWAREKIVHLMYKGSFPDGMNDLGIEMIQRQMLYNNTRNVKHDSDDIMLISDVDEIPSREALAELRINPPPEPVIYEQDYYYYNIHCPIYRHHLGTVATPFSHKIKSIEVMRGNKHLMPRRSGGWHFSYFMNHQEIVQKLSSFAHWQYAKPPYTDKEYIAEHIKNGTNFLLKNKGKAKPKPLPDYLIAEMEKYPVFVGKAL